MKKHMKMNAVWVGTLTIGLSFAGLSNSASAQIDLATTMNMTNDTGYLAESQATGSFARINLGDGSLGSIGSNTGDADGLYNFVNREAADPGSLFGTPVDMFPREENFEIGGLTHAPVTGVGIETVQVLMLDTSEFWKPDPARTDFINFDSPTVISDISDYGIGIWFFNGPGAITFGPLDVNDTVTYTDGLLTSIDLEVETVFNADAFGTAVSYTGTFSITGDQLSYQIEDTQPLGFFGNSQLIADLTGTVDAVGTFVIPEPASAILLALGSLTMLARHRRD